MLARNLFKQALVSKKPQVGLWVSLCHPLSAEVVAGSGFDWALLDMEHAPNEVGIVLNQLQAFNASTTTPIVRPMWNDMVLTKRLLDIGVSGLLFPMVQNREEAEAAVSFSRYPPDGVRGVSVTTRANQFGRDKNYFDRVSEETCVIVQVETKGALELVEDIASVDGIDGVFFGPADIGADLGFLGQPTHPEVWKAIYQAADKVKAMDIPVGTLVSDAERAVELFEQGFTFVACGSDLGLLTKGADQLLRTVKDSF